jgi:hypothetical protein
MKRFFCDGRSLWFIDTIWAAAAGLPPEQARIDDIHLVTARNQSS